MDVTRGSQKSGELACLNGLTRARSLRTYRFGFEKLKKLSKLRLFILSPKLARSEFLKNIGSVRLEAQSD